MSWRVSARLSGGESGKVRLLVVGGRGVGKTALTVRYLTKRYIGEYIPNTGSYITRRYIGEFIPNTGSYLTRWYIGEYCTYPMPQVAKPHQAVHRGVHTQYR